MVAPTGLIVVLIFARRGAFNMLPKRNGRVWNPPLRVCVAFDILLVGAIHNVFKENLRLAKQSPLDRQFAKQIWTHGPYSRDVNFINGSVELLRFAQRKVCFANV